MNGRSLSRVNAALPVVAALLGGGCEREPPPDAAKRVIRLVRDTTLSEPLALEFNRNLSNVEVRLADFPAVGSYATIDAIARGEADLGFALADVAYFSYIEREDQAHSQIRLRGIAALQATPVHLLTRPGLAIRDIDDLQHLRVATGTGVSQLARLADLIFRAYGVDPEGLQTDTLPTTATVTALTSATIDAAFVTGYYPSSVAQAATSAGARLLSIDGPPAERMRKTYPFVRTVRIPPHTYPGQRETVTTLGVDRLLICRSDLDEHIVHDLTKELLAALPRLATTLRTSLRLMDLEQASAMPLPLHKGAAQYYRERELSR